MQAVGAITHHPIPMEKIGFRGMGATKPYKFVWFRDIHATEPYVFIGIGACKILSITRLTEKQHPINITLATSDAAMPLQAAAMLLEAVACNCDAVGSCFRTANRS
jgi:hypothetical protein